MKGTGYITTEYTVWCGYEPCAEWNQDAMARSKTDAIRKWKLAGWKKIKGCWYCPKCVEKLK